jgi:hypothetical protein
VVKGIKPGLNLGCGMIGKGDKDQYWAHLHFKIRTKPLPASEWPGNMLSSPLAAAFIKLNDVDPLKFLAKVKAFRRFEDLG